LPTRILEEVRDASFEKSIAAEADTLAFVIALFAIVTEPVFEMVASPETATEVGTFEALPTKTFPEVKLASFEKAIAAEVPTFVLLTTPLARVEARATFPDPSKEMLGAVTSPVTEKALLVERVFALEAVPLIAPLTDSVPVMATPVELTTIRLTPSIEPVIVPVPGSATVREESPAPIVFVAPPP
jgi:hypothetical protein